MKIIDELIDDISSSTAKLTDILIKAKVLAHKLKLKEMAGWINSELNGYPSPDSIPEYRKTRCRVIGTISDGYSRMNNFPIPLPDGI